MKALMHLTRLLHPRNSPCQHMNADERQECTHVRHDRSRGMNACLQITLQHPSASQDNTREKESHVM